MKIVRGNGLYASFSSLDRGEVFSFEFFFFFFQNITKGPIKKEKHFLFIVPSHDHSITSKNRSLKKRATLLPTTVINIFYIKNGEGRVLGKDISIQASLGLP